MKEKEWRNLKFGNIVISNWERYKNKPLMIMELHYDSYNYGIFSVKELLGDADEFRKSIHDYKENRIYEYSKYWLSLPTDSQLFEIKQILGLMEQKESFEKIINNSNYRLDDIE